MSHVSRIITSSDTRRGSSSRSMGEAPVRLGPRRRWPCARTSQSAVSEPTRLSVPFEAMSSALNQPLAHRMGEGLRVRVVTGRNLRLVVHQVLVERRARWHTGLLQLDDHQRQSVDEAHQIRAAGVERARDAELADQQEIIVRRLLATGSFSRCSPHFLYVRC